MTKCPFCDAELVEERREIEKGVWATVEVCPNCRDEWIDKVGHDRLVGLFKRKTFNLGGSEAVRIPKEIADALSIGAGTSVDFMIQGRQDDNFEGVRRPGRCFRASSLPFHSVIAPAAACRIISASSELITLSLPTSAAEAGRWIK